MVCSQLSSCLAETKQSSATWPFCFTVSVLLLLETVNEFPSVIDLTHAYKCPFWSTQRTETHNMLIPDLYPHCPPLVSHPLSKCPVEPEIQLYIAFLFFLKMILAAVVIACSCLKILCWFPTVDL